MSASRAGEFLRIRNGEEKPVTIEKTIVRPGFFDSFAENLKTEVRDERVLFCPVGYGGYEDFSAYLEKPLRDAGLSFETFPLEQSDSSRGEYREILTPAEAVKTYDATILIPFEASVVRKGKGVIGALVWSLYGIRDGKLPGIRKVYLSAMIDKFGIAHFPVVVEYEKFLGPINFMGRKENRMQGTYRELTRSRLFSYVADYTPPRETPHQEIPVNVPLLYLPEV